MNDPVKIGNATLYLADFRDVVPDLAPPYCVVTDPPFGIDGGSGGDSQTYGKGNYKSSWPDTPEYIETAVVPPLSICIEIATAAAVTPGSRCMHLYPKARDMGCFWQPAAVTHGPWGMVTFSPILYYGKDRRAGKAALPTGTVSTAAPDKNGHPCPKPFKVWRWLVEKVAHPGMPVLDPFMGSGTSGVACADLGLDFIGIEIEPKYFFIACERIERAQSQQRLFA